tara:strand:- start:519 stop:716 length:198 start_codon:yes stop_codon:yes gene_type:complete
VNKKYADFFRTRLEELSHILKNRPQIGVFHTVTTERSQMKNLITIYNLNLKLLKIFDPKEERLFI